ncbi:MAG: iron-containing alcohol dehydrogenase [Myxococcota bacterium]
MATVWSFPTRVLFGAGSIDEIGPEAKALGAKHVMIISDKGVVNAGLLERVHASLQAAGLGFAVFDEVSSNPTEQEALRAGRAYTDSQSDLVLAVGGGSPLDVGKLVCLLANHSGSLSEYDEAKGGASKIVLEIPPLIAVPTTAGTGSEVGRSAVVTIEETNRKTVVHSSRLLADLAILDPELTVSMPPVTTAATGFDALTHCIEAYCARGDHPMADAIALSGIQLASENLERAVDQGSDLAARSEMMKASMMGAVAFQKGLGACHSLANPLSAELGLHHGLANALCLPAVMDFNRGIIQDRVAHVARILGVKGDDSDTLAFECAGAIRLLRRKVGLPDGLSAADVEEDQLPRLAKLALDDACHRTNPRNCTEEDMHALYKASM